MQYPSAFIAIFAATAVLSLPLNINMGAYSPALVVGDGAIGFEGANGADQVANLMNTLLGASNTGTAGNPNAAALPPAAAPPAAPAKPTPSAPAAGEVAAESLPQGMGKVVNTISTGKRELTAQEEQESLKHAQEEAATMANTKRELTAQEEQESLKHAQEEAATMANTKRELTAQEEQESLKHAQEEAAMMVSTGKRDLTAQEEQESLKHAQEEAATMANTKRELTAQEEQESLKHAQEEAATMANTKRQSTAEEGQDLGAQIDDVDHYTFDKRAAAKRDLTGFKAALAYSMNALMAGPEVQLGTGAHGSGVGIIQKAGGSKTAPSGGGTH
ncbi:uncharacterized protein L3040_000669 [Drepanopeziza brunnea f. sp. 'multigermtubi']|uniref:uncharacterized protein n=1 Tax=Drepanopeziza brunnea f. sp. 'multigermtubi' TaxID=698441 RepID=UPI0023821512|nr:hypothetical protein L3040_000669 [Drepanopeziza brunnea f. sp. 'multigermtubi']